MQASLYGRSHFGKYALDFLYFPIKIVVVCFILKLLFLTYTPTCIFHVELMLSSKRRSPVIRQKGSKKVTTLKIPILSP
jgi:hypothetical protein